MSQDCARLLLLERGATPEPGAVGVVEDYVVWWNPLTSVADTVAVLGGLEAWVRTLDGASRPFSLPWGTVPAGVAYAGGRLVHVGDGRSPSFNVVTDGGAVRHQVRWRQAGSSVTAADKSAYERARSGRVAELPPEREVELLFPRLDEFPALPSEKPVFDRMLTDREGGTWLRSFPENSFGPVDRQLGVRPGGREEWMVFDAAGNWRWVALLPERFELKTVSAERLYGISRDSLDVETVRVLVSSGN
jgi:hypothetical protein